MNRRSGCALALGCALGLALSWSAPAHAKRTGMNLGCVNCHEGENKPKVTAMLSSPRVEPGQAVTITVTATHPTAKVGGVLVDSKGLGAFELVDPVGTHLFEGNATQATHAMPQPYANGQVQFSFRWVAPQMTGPVPFDVWSNAGNDNGEPKDDSPAEITAAVAVGCDGQWYYLDADADGQGEDATRIFSCDPVPGRITKGGDCNDANKMVSSTQPEICNLVDDNCDGQIDEGFQPVLLGKDGDGDGYGARTGETKLACKGEPGFADNFQDCDDRNPAVHPGATEVVNGADDDCNGTPDDVKAPMPMPTTSGGTSSAPAAPPASNGGGCAFTPHRSSGALLAIGALVLAATLTRRSSRRPPRR